MTSSQLALIRRRKRMMSELVMITVVVIQMLTVLHRSLGMMLAAVNSLPRPRYSNVEKKRLRIKHLNRLIKHSDIICKSELRVNRQIFYVLCEMVRDIGGLSGTRNMSLEEIVAMFLYTLSHHFKNRTIGNHFFRSGESVSRNFHRCLRAVLKLHVQLLKKPTPITAECEDSRWKCFQVHSTLYKGTYIPNKCS